MLAITMTPCSYREYVKYAFYRDNMPIIAMSEEALLNKIMTICKLKQAVRHDADTDLLSWRAVKRVGEREPK